VETYLSESFEFHLNAQPEGGAFPFSRLRLFAHRLLGLPALGRLKPLVQRAVMVMEPAGRLFIKREPTRVAYCRDDVITVLSANLWHDWPRHRRLFQRLEAFARLVETEKVDILLLQEVARTPDVRVDQWLAERLDMAYVYSRANGHHRGIGFEEGLAVFSHFPLDVPRIRQLRPNFEPFARRLVLGADVKTPRGSLPVFSVHLSLLPSHNAAQVHHLQSWVVSITEGRPALVGGDFNAHEHASQITRMRRTWLDVFRYLHPYGDGATHELRLPWRSQASRRRLDYIFFCPGNCRWKVLEACHLDAPGGPHSDHRAVLAKIAVDL
jgi:endonuclease/exonuclease/phosphatase family metal-dependent hydrolase